MNKVVDVRALREALRPATVRTVGHRIDQVRPVDPVLAPLLPWPGLRYGATLAIAPTVGATSLLLALAARASAGGVWWAAVGQPDLGMVAAADLGVDLSRTLLVPDPGPDPIAVVDAMGAGCGLVSYSPAGPVTEPTARLLAARLRQHGTVLLVRGAWPVADVRLRTEPVAVTGLGQGRGRIRSRTLAIEATARSRPPRRIVVCLPDPAGRLAAAPDVQVDVEGGVAPAAVS